MPAPPSLSVKCPFTWVSSFSPPTRLYTYIFMYIYMYKCLFFDLFMTVYGVCPESTPPLLPSSSYCRGLRPLLLLFSLSQLSFCEAAEQPFGPLIINFFFFWIGVGGRLRDHALTPASHSYHQCTPTCCNDPREAERRRPMQPPLHVRGLLPSLLPTPLFHVSHPPCLAPRTGVGPKGTRGGADREHRAHSPRRSHTVMWANVYV